MTWRFEAAFGSLVRNHRFPEGLQGSSVNAEVNGFKAESAATRYPAVVARDKFTRCPSAILGDDLPAIGCAGGNSTLKRRCPVG